jgi:phosphate:Na+ symporter
MGFALVSAGAITEFSGIYPIIIGANIGTCVTGLLSSIGTSIDARRIALAHLGFNIISTTLAIASAPLFYKYIPLTSGDIIHQAANANTIKMMLSALLFLPLTSLYGKCIQAVVRSKKKQPEPSFLDRELVNRPEQAIFSCLRELRRTACICAQSLRLAAQEFVQHDPKRENTIAVNEQSVNAIKSAMGDYLASLTGHYLSKRQAILLEHIDRCMSDLERVGDHIENLSTTARRQRSTPAAQFGQAAFSDWFAVHHAVEALLAKVIASLDPEVGNFQEMAAEIIELREAFMKTALAAQRSHLQRLEAKAVTPIAGMIFNDCLSHFWRITKHIKSIALAEQQPQFWIRTEKLDQIMTNAAPGYALPSKADLDDHLARLQSDDYL